MSNTYDNDNTLDNALGNANFASETTGQGSGGDVGAAREGEGEGRGGSDRRDRRVSTNPDYDRAMEGKGRGREEVDGKATRGQRAESGAKGSERPDSAWPRRMAHQGREGIPARRSSGNQAEKPAGSTKEFQREDSARGNKSLGHRLPPTIAGSFGASLVTGITRGVGLGYRPPPTQRDPSQGI
jgi:hypothetical protein